MPIVQQSAMKSTGGKGKRKHVSGFASSPSLSSDDDDPMGDNQLEDEGSAGAMSVDSRKPTTEQVSHTRLRTFPIFTPDV
jgi:hypothetical protein